MPTDEQWIDGLKALGVRYEKGAVFNDRADALWEKYKELRAAIFELVDNEAVKEELLRKV